MDYSLRKWNTSFSVMNILDQKNYRSEILAVEISKI